MNTKQRDNGVFLSLVLAILVLAISGLATAQPTPAANKAGCITWTTETRYEGLGYNHYVHFESACKEAMVCQVTTNANPDPTTATIAPGGKATVLTFRGSPASEFTARVTCAKK